MAILHNYTGTASDFAAFTIVPRMGATYFVTDTNTLYTHNGSAWVQTFTESNTRKLATASVLIGTGAAHSAGDVVSTDAGEILQFTHGLPSASSGVILSSLVTLDQNAVFSAGAGYYLYLFSASPTAQADDAAFDMTAGDVAKYIGKITLGTLVDNGSTCEVNTVGHNFDFTSVDTKLYGKLVCIAGETTISGKTLTINLGIAAL